ncbi:hypothetical protein IMZ48_09640 [Candidatus Bathyarchaeota archaeon]|nr:hypothetical protein [Candidatus Bathyarchaeota archaeon]
MDKGIFRKTIREDAGAAPAAAHRVKTPQTRREEAKLFLAPAQTEHPQDYGRRRDPMASMCGDLVPLSIRNLRPRRPSRTLADKLTGPYLVKKVSSTKGKYPDLEVRDYRYWRAKARDD